MAPRNSPSTSVATAPLNAGTHRPLLIHVDPAAQGFADVDAVVVPTARDVARLMKAMDLAVELNATLVALCSKDAAAADAMRIADARSVDFWAVDVTDAAAVPLPDFRVPHILARAGLSHASDTDVKRNIALWLGQAAGWRNLVFLDDDITLTDVDDLRRCARLLLDNPHYHAVGLTVADFPDNSVVCHANRDTGGRQETFVGAGALVVNPQENRSFFPGVYNEDWFFLLDAQGLLPTAVLGSAKQDPYNPYQRPARASCEEFGDVLAEGIFALLDNGSNMHDAGERYWRRVLRRRLRFIDHILDRARQSEFGESIRIALTAAKDVHRDITPALCREFLDAWLLDREQWLIASEEFRKKLEETPDWSALPARKRLEFAAQELGLRFRRRPV